MSISQELVQSFRPPAFPGSYLLSFEGIEGAGKSTQIIIAKDFLEAQGFQVIILREPGGTKFGERLRQAILSSEHPIAPIAEMHLFLSSRAQLLTEVTLKELNQPGTIVIYDRYIDSTIAYQGTARGLGIETILKSHQNFPLTLMPHLTFYLEISPEFSNQRQKLRNAPKDYFEKNDLDFYKKLVEGYQKAAELFPKRVVKIDGQADQKTVSLNIQSHLQKLIHSLHPSKNS